VQFSSTDLQAALPANYSFTSGDAGTHVFIVTLKTAGSPNVQATDVANSALTGSATVLVNAATAVSLLVTGPSQASAGVAFTITVTAYDAYGNVATGYLGTVQFSSTDSMAGLPANYSFSAADNGSHTFNVTLNTLGTQSITVADLVSPSISGSTSGIVVS
jgi:hypothetical protein